MVISVKIAIGIILAFLVGIIFGASVVYSVLSDVVTKTFEKTFDKHINSCKNALSIIHGLKDTYAVLENEIESVEGVRTQDEEELDEVDENYIRGIIYAMDVMRENIDSN